jgi:hypothetical protein
MTLHFLSLILSQLGATAGMSPFFIWPTLWQNVVRIEAHWGAGERQR